MYWGTDILISSFIVIFFYIYLYDIYDHTINDNRILVRYYVDHIVDATVINNPLSEIHNAPLCRLPYVEFSVTNS